MRTRRLLLLALIAWLATPLPAQAYLDPASGSLILQLIVSGVAGLALVLKLYWHKLKAMLGLSKENPEGD